MKCPFLTPKDKQAFFRRLVVLLIVYLMVMTGVWTMVSFLFFPEGLNDPWLIAIFTTISVLLFISLVVIVEVQHLRRRK